MRVIDYKNVEVRQEDMHVLGDVTFSVEEGDFVYLIGKVGSGKSSLLKTLYAELDPICGQDGHAFVLGEDVSHLKRKRVPALRRQMGVIFQDFQLLTDRNVFDNLYFVLKATGWKGKQQMRQRIFEVLDMVGMDTKGYKMPHELSGGEQQRISIARALLNSPKLILADEPTGNLDPDTGRQIVEILYKVRQSGTAVVMITHNLQWLTEYPGRTLKCHDRRLIEETAEEDGKETVTDTKEDTKEEETIKTAQDQ